jgi:hypothetical protein
MRARKPTHLSIPRRTTWIYGWPIFRNGQPLDMTDWTVWSQVRATLDSPDVLHEWSTANENVAVGGGILALRVDPDVSQAWGWTEGVYDVEAVSPLGETLYVSSGSVFVGPRVTRDGT